jgi:protein O-GlcNAc transferase
MSDTLLRDAFQLHQAGRLADAARLYSQVLKTEPKRFDALYLLGLTHLQRGGFAEAERLLSEAARIEDNLAGLHAARGTALSQLKRHDEALAAYDRAVKLKSGDAQIWNNRGNALLELGRHADAVASYDRALHLQKDSTGTLRHRALALSLLGRRDEALADLDKALALNPSYVDALDEKGHVLMQMHRHAEAEAVYAKALSFRPERADLHYNRGNALSILQRYDEAIAECEKALAIAPGYPYARGVLVHSKLQACDWRGLSLEVETIRAGLEAGKRVVSPFNFKTLSDSPAEQLQCARVWVENERPAGIAPLRLKTRPHDRIRLAYVSADFNASAVSTLMAGVFEKHDATRFETVAISFGSAAPTPMRARLESAFGRFVDVRGKSDFEIAALMRDTEIDIAVDLMGYTGACRSWILAWRPAPVQVNFLGFPGTMGADHIDYIIADRIVIPESDHAHYSEKVAYLPDCYLPNDATRSIAARTPSRSELGLPEAGFVFACFNNAYKFSPALFDIWMRLLSRTPGSVLWLPESAATANLQREVEAHGVAANRLVFSKPVAAPDEHLARLRRIDLFLDTLPYNAHSTAIDALLAGVPVLTFPGHCFQGRVAASLLTSLGMPALIAPTLAEYEALALRLAHDPASLSALRERIAGNHAPCPLFDTERFTRHLEAAFTTMWERHARGLPPAAFAVAP